MNWKSMITIYQALYNYDTGVKRNGLKKVMAAELEKITNTDISADNIQVIDSYNRGLNVVDSVTSKPVITVRFYEEDRTVNIINCLKGDTMKLNNFFV